MTNVHTLQHPSYTRPGAVASTSLQTFCPQLFWRTATANCQHVVYIWFPLLKASQFSAYCIWDPKCWSTAIPIVWLNNSDGMWADVGLCPFAHSHIRVGQTLDTVHLHTRTFDSDVHHCRSVKDCGSCWGDCFAMEGTKPKETGWTPSSSINLQKTTVPGNYGFHGFCRWE